MIHFTHFQTFPKIPTTGQKFQPKLKIHERGCPCHRITMTIVTITERILFSLANNATV